MFSVLYNSRNKIPDSYKRRVSVSSVIAVVKSRKLSLFIYSKRYFLNTSFYNVAHVNTPCKAGAIDATRNRTKRMRKEGSVFLTSN